MGWTDPPPQRSERSTALRVFNVVAISAGILAAVGLGIAILAAVVLGSIFREVGKPRDLYKPTAAESRAAVTTVPIAAGGCASFARVDAATLRAADATNYLNPPPRLVTPSDSLRALRELHVALIEAIAYARGPMGQRLRNVDRQVWIARREIASWQGVMPRGRDQLVPSDVLATARDDGYTELRIAERLLGRTCGGRLAPEAMRVLFGPCFVFYTTTTRAGVTTTSQRPRSPRTATGAAVRPC